MQQKLAMESRAMSDDEPEKNGKLESVLAAIDETWRQLELAMEYGDTIAAIRLRKQIKELAKECDQIAGNDPKAPNSDD